MIIYYSSLSGNVRRFLARLPDSFEARNIADYPAAAEPFVLVTYTFGFGQPPVQVAAWLKNNSRFMIGVAASGNRNWGDQFAAAGDLIAKYYNVPLLLKFELSGTTQDNEEFTRKAVPLYANISNVK